MDASANAKQQWTPEVAARLRGVMIAFVAVLLLSMVTTIAYVAGRTVSTPAVPSYVQAAPLKAAPSQPGASAQPENPLRAETPMPAPQRPVVVPQETVRHAEHQTHRGHAG